MTTCAQWREAVSARLDGEDPDVPPRVIDAHLEVCADCRRFAARIGALDVAMAATDSPVPDRSVDILAAVRADRRIRTPRPAVSWRPAPRIALALVGAIQLVTSLPYLWSLVGGHTVRDLAAFQLAVGVGFLVAAARPATAAGLLPTAGALVAVLAVVVVADIAGGRVAAGGETIHATEAAGVALLWLLTPRRGTPPRPRLT